MCVFILTCVCMYMYMLVCACLCVCVCGLKYVIQSPTVFMDAVCVCVCVCVCVYWRVCARTCLCVCVWGGLKFSLTVVLKQNRCGYISTQIVADTALSYCTHMLRGLHRSWMLDRQPAT